MNKLEKWFAEKFHSYNFDKSTKPVIVNGLFWLLVALIGAGAVIVSAAINSCHSSSGPTSINPQPQDIRGGSGVNINDLKAGRDIHISISNQALEDRRQPSENIPFVYVSPVEFKIYKPSKPQVPTQTKAWIKVRLINQSNVYNAYNVHVTFLTDDGTGHRTDSDSWNTKMGAPSLYTFDNLAPQAAEYAVWRPDIPNDSEQRYKISTPHFQLAVHVSWQDRARNRYEFLTLSELRYNSELNTFLFEVKETYDSRHDPERLEVILKKFRVVDEGGHEHI